MPLLKHLVERNHEWAEGVKVQDPDFFSRLSNQQAPEYLWIGCADSRVPANQIVDLMPGELFVHRNVANVVVHTDFNCLSVVQYAIDVLKVKHIIVVGHYGCGGIRGALRDDSMGLINNWLRHVQDVLDRHEDSIRSLPDEEAQANRLCELNVIEQVRHVCQTTIVQDAWRRGQPVSVHGWIYSVADGRVRDLGICATGVEEWEGICQRAVEDVLTVSGENSRT